MVRESHGLRGTGLAERLRSEVQFGDGRNDRAQAKAGDRVTVTVRGLGLDFDASVQLVDPHNKPIAENDDHETNSFGVNPPDPQIVDFKITKDGQYEVIVQEINGEAGSFVLTITVRR